MPKLCKDCLHCKPAQLKLFFINILPRKLGNEYAKCDASFRRPEAPFLVDGTIEVLKGDEKYKYCSISREYGPCGEEAKLFEAKK